MPSNPTFRFLPFFLLLLVACYGTSHMTFTKEGGQIPPDFGQQTDTLLVLSHPDDWGYDHYLRNNFKDNYAGPYRIIRVKEISAFPPERYRFVFEHSLNYSSQQTVGGPNDGHRFTYASSDVFYIRDRKTKLDYVTKSSSAYSKLMRAYIQALSATLQK